MNVALSWLLAPDAYFYGLTAGFLKVLEKGQGSVGSPVWFIIILMNELGG
jgi:hypothetical protein